MRGWNGPGGYREVLQVGLPLVASMGSVTVMQFTDRVFLSNYSLEAISAALPAGVTFFLCLSFFFGTATYVGVFISQYCGATRYERVGASLWQGIWFCLLSGLVLWGLSFFAGPIFALAGHEPAVAAMEADYFSIMTRGGVLVALDVCLSSFYSGRGLTRTVMVANFLGMLVNIPLDYCLIYGVGFPEMGIRGAALATVASWGLIVGLYARLIFTHDNDRRFAVRRAWRLSRELFGRLMRYGAVGGLEFALDIFAVTFFFFAIGRLGVGELAATNIIFSIHSLVFLPLIGLSNAASILVGQAMGRERPDEAARATRSAMRLSLAYSGLAALCFVSFPRELLGLFRPGDLTPEAFGPIADLGANLMWFMAAFCLIDAPALIIFGTLKGAGDVRFLLAVMVAASLLGMIGPLLLALSALNAGIYAAWSVFVFYVLFLSVSFGLRYRGGKWRALRIIEAANEPPAASGQT